MLPFYSHTHSTPPTLAPATTMLFSLSIILPFHECHINGVIQDVTFGTGFLSPSILEMQPGCCVCQQLFSFLLTGVPCIVWMDHRLLNHSPPKVVWVASQFLSVMNKAATYICLCSGFCVNIRLYFSGRKAQEHNCRVQDSSVVSF